MTVQQLDFSGREQLYNQLYDILFQDIIGGVYEVGDLIPSESELMRRYGVSRATARKSMEMLASNGLIEKRRGHGSEVISKTPNTSPRRVTSYIRKSVEDHTAPQKLQLESETEAAEAHVSDALALPIGTPVFRLKRIRCAGDRPFYLEINYFEQSFMPDAVNRDFSKESLRAYISDELGAHWSRAMQSIYAVRAVAEQAELLQVKEGAPLLYIRRISYDTKNVPRELVETWYRSDLYHLEIELYS